MGFDDGKKARVASRLGVPKAVKSNGVDGERVGAELQEGDGGLVAHAKGCGNHEGRGAIGASSVGIGAAFKQGAQSFEVATLATVDNERFARLGAKVVGVGAVLDQKSAKRGVAKSGSQLDGAVSTGHRGEDIDAKLSDDVEKSDVSRNAGGLGDAHAIGSFDVRIGAEFKKKAQHVGVSLVGAQDDRVVGPLGFRLGRVPRGVGIGAIFERGSRHAQVVFFESDAQKNVGRKVGSEGHAIILAPRPLGVQAGR